MNFPKFIFVALSARGASVTLSARYGIAALNDQQGSSLLTETPPSQGLPPADLVLEGGGKLLLEDNQAPLELE